MYKKFRRVLPLFLAMTIIFVVGVTPTSAASEDVYFLGARYIVGKGLLVTLKVSDEALDQEANVVINGITYPLACSVAETMGDWSILHCLADVGASQAIGDATVGYGTDSFATNLTEPRDWCFATFDYGGDVSPWHQWGSYCVVHYPGVGDAYSLFNPEYQSPYEYGYYPNGDAAPDCGPNQPDLGPGWYYNC